MSGFWYRRRDCYEEIEQVKSFLTLTKTDAEKEIKSGEPKALHTHCFTNSLNLAVGDAVKAGKVMKNSLEM